MMPGHVSNAALLAGGRGSRFPASSAGTTGGKLLSDLMGTSLVAMSYARLAKIFPDPFLIAPVELQTEALHGHRMLADEPTGAGPAAGIAAAVRHSSDWCFVAAGDMPFLDEGLIADFRRSVESLPDSAVCAIPQWRKGLEPLHAFYRKTAYDGIIEYLRSGRRSISGLAEALWAVKLDAETAALRTGSELEVAFFNVNTAEDLERARQILRIREVNPKGAKI